MNLNAIEQLEDLSLANDMRPPVNLRLVKAHTLWLFVNTEQKISQAIVFLPRKW
jgi:hypothetical protein